MTDLSVRPARIIYAASLALLLAGCKVEISTEYTSSTGQETTGTQTADSQSPVARVMTYNIQYLNREAANQGNRIEKLRDVIKKLNPTVVAVQEVEDRAAMELVFPPDSWSIIIDDDSPDNQDVAFAVSRKWKVTNIPKDLDADDEHFLAEGEEHESYFPNRRDGLFVVVEFPGSGAKFTAINIHAKARVGGRPQSDPRREGASRVLVEILKKDFANKQVVLMGDFNDTPDDASLNILETGNPDARGEAETQPGEFMLNLTEALWAQGQVTHGAHVKRLNKKTGMINNVYPEARDRNNRTRGREAGTGPLLLDQILVTRNLQRALTKSEATIYVEPIALEGVGFSRTSDHLPVYTDLNLEKLK